MKEEYKEIYMQNVRKFAEEFKSDSAYLINRFLCGYNKDKIRNLLNMWQGELKKDNEGFVSSIKSYKRIDVGFLDMFKYFSLYMSESTPLVQPLTVWRGCDTLEDKAVSGLFPTSTKREIAERFNYGTLLKINLPEGMKVIKTSEILDNDTEDEIILPPSDYKIKSSQNVNLRGMKTRLIEIDVQPKDLLREFAIAFQNPSNDYKIENPIDEEYKRAFAYLTMMLVQRTVVNSVEGQQIEGTGIDGRIDVIRRKGMYDYNDKNTNTNMNKAFLLMNSEEKLPAYILEPMNYQALKDIKSTLQIGPKQFFDYIEHSEQKEVFYDYKSVEDHKKFYMYQDHGIRHVDNVTMFTYYIASKEGYSKEGIRILLEAARFHDIGRTNSWQEGGHGSSGGKKYVEEFGTELPLYERQIIKFLISSHDLPNQNQIPEVAKKIFGYLNEDEIKVLCDMANVIRDADALDRTRFPIYSSDYLNSKLLTHESSKELVEVAQTLNYRQDQQKKSKNNKTKQNKQGQDVVPR